MAGTFLFNITFGSNVLIVHGTTDHVDLSCYNSIQVMFICKLSEKTFAWITPLCSENPTTNCLLEFLGSYFFSLSRVIFLDLVFACSSLYFWALVRLKTYIFKVMLLYIQKSRVFENSNLEKPSKHLFLLGTHFWGVRNSRRQ